jgi:hypothetical protein
MNQKNLGRKINPVQGASMPSAGRRSRNRGSGGTVKSLKTECNRRHYGLYFNVRIQSHKMDFIVGDIPFDWS